MKKILLIPMVIMLVGSTAALQIDIDVPALRNASVLGMDSANSTEGLHEFNATVENIGSTGCKYRLEAGYRHGNNSEKLYSQEKELWPGSSETARVYAMPTNYTGQVNASVTVHYCRTSQDVANFSFKVEENQVADKEFNNTVTRVNSSAAEVKFPGIKEALLVPETVPPYWRVPHSKIRNGSTTVEYNPTLFREGKEIRYKVVQKNELKGYTTVKLEEKEGWVSKVTSMFKDLLG